MRILLVEDDLLLANTLQISLSELAHSVDHIENGKTAYHTLMTEDYDVVILDLTLPDMDGVDVLKKIRDQRNYVPIIVLTARQEVASRVLTLNHGADDYLIKPFDFDELIARLGAVARRNMMQKKSVVTIGNFRFDSAARRIFVNDKEINIPKRELSLLECLLNRQGKVVSKELILERIYSLDEVADIQVIDLYMHRLRKRLKDVDRLTITTLRGLGFLLDVKDTS